MRQGATFLPSRRGRGARGARAPETDLEHPLARDAAKGAPSNITGEGLVNALVAVEEVQARHENSIAPVRAANLARHLPFQLVHALLQAAEVSILAALGVFHLGLERDLPLLHLALLRSPRACRAIAKGPGNPGPVNSIVARGIAPGESLSQALPIAPVRICWRVARRSAIAEVGLARCERLHAPDPLVAILGGPAAFVRGFESAVVKAEEDVEGEAGKPGEP